MIEFKSGVLDVTRLVSNILMILLVCMNIYFSINYVSNIKLNAERDARVQVSSESSVKIALALKEFINIVIANDGEIQYSDRVKLENSILQIDNPILNDQWNKFVNSESSAEAQRNAIKVMTTLANLTID